MRTFLLIVKLISIAMLVWLISYLGTVYNSSLFNFANIAVLLGDLRDLLSYYFYIGFGYLFIGVAELFRSLFASMIYLGGIRVHTNFYRQMTLLMFYYIFGRYFYFPELEAGEIPTITKISELSSTLSFQIGPDIYLTILQFITIIMLIYAIRAIAFSDPKFAINVVVLVNLIIIIPLFIMGIQQLFAKFLIQIDIINQLVALNLLDPELLAPVSEDFIEFMGSKIFMFAMINFFFLEFSFQVSYIDQVTKPSVEREVRLKNQIIYLKNEAQKAIANLKKMEEKRDQARLELLKAQEEEGPMFQSEHMKLVEFMSGKGSKRFSYIAEMIEKKKIEREEKALETAMKGTRQLVYFLDKLFVQNPESYHTLTAKTSAPSPVKLITSTVINMAFRFGMVLLLTFFSSHPKWFVESIFQAPESISMSVEMLTPESILSVLLPLILLFPVVSQIIRASKHQKLQELLRLEEMRRAGLTEEEMAEVLRRNKAEKIEETKFEADTNQPKPMEEPTMAETAPQ